MSFSSALKKEICQNRQFLYAHKKAVCFGLLLFGRCFDQDRMALLTENQSVSRLYSELLYELVEIKTSITATEQILGEGRKFYEVTVDGAEDRLEILKFFAPVYRDFQCASPQKPREMDFLRGMLCGAFLSCANIVNPRKSYHLEFLTHNDMAFDSLSELMDKLSLHCRVTERKGVRILYLKSSEEIEDVLTLLGAGKSALEIMNVKIYKDMRNKVNRITNCETANIDRTVSAAASQVAQIRLIERTAGLDSLPQTLQEIALLRLQNPESPLSELAGMLTPPISRSGAHYRFSQISAIAKELEAKYPAVSRKGGRREP